MYGYQMEYEEYLIDCYDEGITPKTYWQWINGGKK